MKPIQILFTGLLLASLLPGCEIHDDIDVDVKRMKSMEAWKMVS